MHECKIKEPSKDAIKQKNYRMRQRSKLVALKDKIIELEDYIASIEFRDMERDYIKKIAETIVETIKETEL